MKKLVAHHLASPKICRQASNNRWKFFLLGADDRERTIVRYLQRTFDIVVPYEDAFRKGKVLEKGRFMIIVLSLGRWLELLDILKQRILCRGLDCLHGL